MSDQSELWAAVVVSYESTGLIQLTNIRDVAATSILTAKGEDAAKQVVDLWPAYAEVAYDSTDSLHLAVGKRATIAVLWERGGTSTTIAKQEWDDVFTSGLIEKLKLTGPRSRRGPNSNSNLTQATGLTSAGQRKIPWADVEALPTNYMPNSLTARP